MYFYVLCITLTRCNEGSCSHGMVWLSTAGVSCFTHSSGLLENFQITAVKSQVCKSGNAEAI